jgi:hypothetical protein
MLQDEPGPEDVSSGDGSVERPPQRDRNEHSSSVADAAECSVEGNVLARESGRDGGVGQRSEEGG